MFGRVELKDFQIFEQEIRDKLSELEARVNRPVAESVADAKEAARVASESASNARVHEAEIERLVAELKDLNGSVANAILTLQANTTEAQEANSQLLQEVAGTRSLYEEIYAEKNRVLVSTQSVAEDIGKINSYLKQSEDLPSNVQKAASLLTESKTIHDNIQGLLNHSLKKKGEIDDLYKEVYGDDVKDDAGNLEHVDGTKDELSRAYNSISDKLGSLENELKRAVAETSGRHETLLDAQRQAFDNLLSDSGTRFKSVNEQLTGLLPGAMAEGLSAAYEQKKLDEINSLAGFDRNFRWGIGGMVGVSLIPFVVNLYLLVWKQREIVDLIKDMPSVVAAILPLYFPVLWLAYTSNKRANLSKRLIEEYTHKAVLGKTFSGLSNQIETLKHQGDVKEELRTRLLFNVLQVSAENPGKLITNYSKSDHPLMDALENSAKLADSIGTLSKIPGFASLAKKLSAKADDLLKTQSQKVDTGLEAHDALDSTPEAKTPATNLAVAGGSGA